MLYDNVCDISEMLGRTIVEIDDSEADDAKIVFKCDDGSIFCTYHFQDCCENVWFEDSDNPLQSLIGEKILKTFVNSKEDDKATESGTYTFYTLASFNVSVAMRFCGHSNGYYSESVEFCKISD